MAIELPVGAALYIDVSEDNSGEFYPLSEHNRTPISIGSQRIEKSQRMSNGTLRKIFVADKRTVSTSWSMLPTFSTMTVDGGWGAGDMRQFYLDKGKGAFQVMISFNDNSDRTETFNAVFTSASFTVAKRNVNLNYNIPYQTVIPTSVSVDGLEVTCQASNEFIVGEKVTLSNLDQSKFNVTKAIITAASPTSFSFEIDANEITQASVTEASAASGEITYICDNTFVPGDIVTISGLSTTAFNISSVMVIDSDDYFFTVESDETGTAVINSTSGLASLSSITNTYTITGASPNSAAHTVTYTIANNKIVKDDIVTISNIRPRATITGAIAHTTTGQIKYTAANSFAVGDYINITGIKPTSLNQSNAVILERAADYFVIEGTVPEKFRKSGIANSVLNATNAVVTASTSSTFTISLPAANGLPMTGITGKATKAVDWKAEMFLSAQEFWDADIALEEV